MVLASRVEPLPTIRTPASALHVLVDAQNMLARSTEHYLFVPLISWPRIRLVDLLCVVTADAGVELLAAEVLDGDDVQRRVPVRTLSQWSDGETVNDWRQRRVWCGSHVALA